MSAETYYYPLTHPQQRIWYTEKFYQCTSIGNIAATVRVKEGINYQLFVKVINILLEKNDGLRLRIVDKDGQVMQYISEYRYVKIDILDFSSDGLNALYDWESKQVGTPFLLEDSNLFYFALIKISDHETCLFMKLHHLIIDAWSMVLLANKILEYYNNFKNENEVSHDFPSYTEFIEREQEYKKSKRFINDIKYWNNKFETLPEPASLKSKDTGFKSAKASRNTFQISEIFATEIRQYCQDHNTSIFSVFLSVLAIYIHRITDNDDIILGTPVLNRSNYKEKDTIGMFVSTVPIRIKMEDNIDYQSFVKYITSDWMGMLKHQRYPYDLLLKDLRKKYKNMDNLYDILLSYQNGKFNKDVGTDFEGRWHSNGYQANSLFIHINDRDGDGRLIIDYDYITQFFNATDIINIHQCLMNLLHDAINNPDKLIKQLDLINEDEKRCILDVFNNSKKAYEKDRTVQQLFELQAAQTPDNNAVVFEDKYLTYHQLNEKSNQMANLLRKKGIKPDSVVGVLTHRSLEMIIGIMAVLKAGGCYLPIDPEYPIDRIDYMLQDSGAKVLLTQESLVSKIHYSGSVIDVHSTELHNVDGSNLDIMNTPDNLAYVIYTSGSTGKPKAVMIEHKALVNYIDAVEQLLDYKSGGTVLSVTTMAFDIFVFEIFPSLAKGLKIVLANEQQQKIPELLSDLIIKEKVEKILTTPSRMQLLVSGQSNKRCFDILKEVVLGGEAFPQKLLDGLKQVTKARIFNMYGPTEATVYSTFKELTEVKDVNIGKPISNYKIYIVDKFFNLVPTGVQGELCISGDSIARGYLNNHELTDEKFVPNPFEPSKRMYRTGDYGRWSNTGEIEFMGRMDHQVKIRGYRIELGEIENQMIRHGLVRDAIVIDREDLTGKKYLCAYFVSEIDIEASEFRELLSRNLPDYMIPSNFTRVKKIPLTPNGKMDRRALPEPEIVLVSTKGYVGPRNDIDKKLVSIWSKILSIKDMGIDDNFFEMGGDSLTIIEIQVEMLECNWSLNTQEFYELNNIRKISDRISGIAEVNHVTYAEKEIAVTSSIVDNSAPLEIYNQGFKYQSVLLTGATGFLGIHLLNDLLSSTDSKVYCIIRGKTDNDARERLMGLFEFYFPNNFRDIDFSRLFVIKGDVSYSAFGLDEQAYKDFGQKVDLVIHTAAIIKYFGDYEDFKKTNVTATGISAHFCMEFNKPLAYMSTLGVSGNYLVGQDQQRPVFTENDFYIGQKYMENVYVRSKFEAEKLLYQKVVDGLKVNIFRLGNLTARYADGQFQPNADGNAFYNTLRSLIRLGAINKEVLEQKLEFTPVDYCSRAIITLLNVEDFSQRVYHVFNHKLITLNSMLEFFKTADINIATMDKGEFSAYIDSVLIDDEKKKYLMGIINDLGQNKFLDFSSIINFDSTITINNLKKLGFEWPKINEVYLGRMIKHMKTKGYIG